MSCEYILVLGIFRFVSIACQHQELSRYQLRLGNDTEA